MILSAAFALEASKPDWSSIQDLVVLIDLFCMYDSATVLGRGSRNVYASGLGNMLRDSGFLRIDDPGNGPVLEDLTHAAQAHLWTFLGNREVHENLDQLFHSTLSYHEIRHGLADLPDRGQEIDLGSKWLKTAPGATDILVELVGETDLRRAARFVVRTFLYLGYHELTGLVFVPDAVRSSLVGNVVASEQEVRERLLAALKAPTRKQPAQSQPPINRISPLAAVAFERASQRKEVLREMGALRDELAPLRNRMRAAEEKIFYGKGVDVSDGVEEWELVAKELQKSFGSDPHLVSLRSILRLGREIGNVVDEPVKAKNWVAFLLGLPFDVASRLLSRRPAVELHHLRDEVPGIGRLQTTVQRLFGTEIRTG